jgi:arylsulfatase A-like enzyme
MDDILGHLQSRLDPQTTLLVMSDHGFGPVYQPVNGDNFIARLNLPQDFAVIAADNFGAKFHIVTTQKPPYDRPLQETYAQTKQILVTRLKELRDPMTGQKVIQEVLGRESIYWGPQIQNAPDIMGVETKGYLFWNWHPTEDQELFPRGNDPALNQFFSAFHMMNGVLMMTGANVRKGMNNFDAQIMDIAPTVLYLLGEPIPEDMDGAILDQPIAEPYKQHHPLDARQDRAAGSQTTRAAIDSSEAINEFIEEQLRAIGYVQ